MAGSSKSGRMVAQSILAIVVGYVIFVLGATVAQETILGGVSYQNSRPEILVAAGLLTPLAAAIGGAFTAAVAPKRPLLHLVPMALLIIVETTTLYMLGRVDGPLWFEAAAGLSLVAGAVAGGYAVVRVLGRDRDARASDR